MGKVESKPLLRPPVAGWKRRICIIGCTRLSAQTGRARSIADAIVNAHKAIYETWYYFDNRSGFKQYLNKILKEMPPVAVGQRRFQRGARVVDFVAVVGEEVVFVHSLF